MSGRGVRTWLHYDNNGCHNLNAQITGEKRCALYAPELVGRLRLFRLGGSNPAHNCSQIDVEQGELADVPCLEATLHAGDLLFIPAWWLHTFLHLGELNTNVNFWWKPEHPLANPVAQTGDTRRLDLVQRGQLHGRVQLRRTEMDKCVAGEQASHAGFLPRHVPRPRSLRK